MMWIAAAPPPDSGDVGVGLIYLIVGGALLWIIFGKHDNGGRD